MCSDELGFVHPMQLTSLHALEDFSPDNQGPFFTRMKRRGKAQEASINSNEQAEDCSRRIEGQEVESELPGYNSDDDSGEVEHGNGKLLYDESAFWCAHGKLAIAVPALAPLYKTAKAEFRVLQKQYAKVTEERCESASCCNGKEMDGRINGIKSCLGLMKEERKSSLEKELMKYTRALVIVNCDFATAWNAR
jgi:protein prenyltransferase alpha subunit repeat containing protein 1